MSDLCPNFADGYNCTTSLSCLIASAVIGCINLVTLQQCILAFLHLLNMF